MEEPAYNVQYAQEAVDDLVSLRALDQRKIVAAIEEHLLQTPTQVSRSRIKRMRQPFWSQFRLRVEDSRVYYDVDEPGRIVSILRLMHKGQKETPERKSS